MAHIAAKKAQQSNEDLREGRKATYNISIFLASEKEKDLKKRAGSNTFMKLAFGEPFDTWKAQLLVRIDKAVKPDKLDINDYELLFTVARTSPAPMAVTSEDEYDDMLERIAKNKDLTCSLYVQALHPKQEKENNWEGSAPLDEEDEPAKKKAKKTKAPKPTDINTANIPHNDNIKALRERWLCHKKPGHAHFDVWAAAMLKGPDVASLTTPPNHHLFSAVAGNQLGQLSPLIERQNRMKNNNGPSTFQLSLSPEVIQLFGKTPAPQTPPAAPPALAAPAPIVQPPPINDEAPLIPRNRLSGPEMPLDQFCAMYHLTDRVRNKLDECGYSGTHTFPYSKWKDLVGEAGLKAGEIAQLKHALFQWTIPTE
ncbi:hypothetical protein NLJ89_g5389 [Agrocybe chaxingu]|uniref:Uncharacterized protein n=1 Tax=Agrocybe chaxingu TaxID=84603 RepID=A0A9W8MTN0_9AGAR|nr:hypothetical protein NLJ89_g5389 [Agrocybe chaxingu]